MNGVLQLQKAIYAKVSFIATKQFGDELQALLLR